MKTSVLVTGHKGYIGSVMVIALLKAGYQVTGLDTGYFHECTLFPDLAEVPWVQKDIRDLEPTDLRGYDAVIHLAALSNDPIGNLNPVWTEEINYQGSVHLAKLAKTAGVGRFLFSSSCIMYGMSETTVVNEESPLAPETEYAKSKVKAEQAISELAEEGFSPTFLRNGTVYGISPRMRFDTVLNNLMAAALTTGKVVLYSDGKPWRPVVHVEDVARSFIAVLEAPISDVHNQVFNNGAEHLNRQIIELAKVVVRTVSDCRLEVLSQPDADQRTYKADFGKFSRVFPKFEFKWKVEEGARQLYETLKAADLTHKDFEDRRYIRVKWLSHLLDTGRLDNSLRWKKQ
jgi:nucleoside-diphosphate-sugar epimerase